MQMPESAAVIVGEIIKTKNTSARNPDGSQGAPDGGAQVAIYSEGLFGHRGATQVKYDASQVASLRPEKGKRVAVVVEYGSYAVNGSKGVTCALIAPVQPPVLDFIASFVEAPGK